ncbi:MAG: XapX domain-containing protein [Janthinobacterium sp.]|uniref:XapX domain-containing protein n=1 Tax=Janthinobacterium sp. TND4EL3 TaxID=1907311 RepID=UPI00095415B5|nr:XapX domain-containing protein [Janthinobacterium sp. TND4EL3]SIR53409.1 XapX domain-containing protein [Janthinobacterium sp. TND4EL3]
MRCKKVILGLLLAFAVGFVCQLARIPVPAPPVPGAALLVFLTSCGYWLTGLYLQRREQAEKREAP